MGKSNKLLIVDDQPSILESLKMLFKKEGIQVFTAQTPINALYIFNVEKPQIVLADLRLGADMDGLTVAGKMKMAIPKTITIAITGYLSSYDLNYCLGSGMFNDVITKPFNNELLLKIVHTFFRKRARWDSVE